MELMEPKSLTAEKLRVYALGKRDGYAAGLKAGEKRLIRAMRRFLNMNFYKGQYSPADNFWIRQWLKQRAKRGKG